MNKVKIYLRTKADIDEMVSIYEKVLGAKTLKKSFGDKTNKEKATFAYLNLFNDINIIIGRYSESYPSYGYSNDFVISLRDPKDFETTYKRIKDSEYFKIDYEPTEYHWGTTIIKAYDKWGYGWILEKKTIK